VYRAAKESESNGRDVFEAVGGRNSAELGVSVVLETLRSELSSVEECWEFDGASVALTTGLPDWAHLWVR